MNVESVRDAVNRIAETMRQNKDVLTELDAQNGDGDLGVSMCAGFSAVAEYLDKTAETDLGMALMKCAGVMNETAPSSLGTILSFGMMGMAQALKGRREADRPGIAGAMKQGVAKIMEKARSRPGEKTILDALCPAVEALERSAGWERAAAAAKEGAERTREMEAVHGRAAYYPGKGIGLLDGGAVAGQLIFEGIAKGE